MNASSVSTVTQTATTTAASSGPALFTLFKLVFIFGVLLIALYFVWQKKNPGRRFNLQAFLHQLSARVKHFLEEEDAEEEEEEDEPVADKSPSFKNHPAPFGLFLLNALDYNSKRTIIKLDDANLEPGDYIQIGYTHPVHQHKRCRQSIALQEYGCTLANTLPENAIVVFRDPNDNQLYIRFCHEAKVNRQDMDSNGKPLIQPFNTKNDVPLTEITEYLHEPIFYVCGLPIAFSVNHRFAKNDGTPNIASFSKRGESYFDMVPENKKNPISKKKAAPVPDDDLPFVHKP